jgi:hypothetical protein
METGFFTSFPQVKISTPDFELNFQSRFGASECSKTLCGSSQTLNKGLVAFLRGMQQHDCTGLNLPQVQHQALHQWLLRHLGQDDLGRDQT